MIDTNVWIEVSDERYVEMLCVLPPEAMLRGAFLVGEASDHCPLTGEPRFACFSRESDGKHYESRVPLTLSTFRSLFS